MPLKDQNAIIDYVVHMQSTAVLYWLLDPFFYTSCGYYVSYIPSNLDMYDNLGLLVYHMRGVKEQTIASMIRIHKI